MFKVIKKIIFSAILCVSTLKAAPGNSVTYVTDCYGCAWDQSIAATQIAPAIALGTIVIVAVVAVAVQNSHGHNHSSSYHSHY